MFNMQIATLFQISSLTCMNCIVSKFDLINEMVVHVIIEYFIICYIEKWDMYSAIVM